MPLNFKGIRLRWPRIKNDFPSNRMLVVGAVIVISVSAIRLWESSFPSSYNHNHYVYRFIIKPYEVFTLVLLIAAFPSFGYFAITLRPKGAAFVLLALLLFSQASYYGAYFADDRMTFPNHAHAVNQIYYEQHRDELLASMPKDWGIEGLKSLGDLCGLQRIGCGCWLFIDPTNTSGLDADAGSLHYPTAKVLQMGGNPDTSLFYTATARRISSSAYSVLSCGYPG